MTPHGIFGIFPKLFSEKRPFSAQPRVHSILKKIINLVKFIFKNN